MIRFYVYFIENILSDVYLQEFIYNFYEQIFRKEDLSIFVIDRNDNKRTSKLYLSWLEINPEAIFRMYAGRCLS